MSNPSFMAEHGARLADNGYAVIPIMPGAKVPGRFSGGAWTPYPDWSRHCDRPTKPFELDIWRRWPGCGVGIACGAVVGLDIDVTDVVLAIQLTDLATEMLGDTPCLRIGQAPKRLLVYRAGTPFAGRKRHPLEVLARGQQFVAHAIHPGTGQPYTWPQDSLLDVPLASLPAVTEAQALAWLDRAYAMIPAELKPRTLMAESAPAGAWKGPSDPRGTFAAVQAALQFIPNEDLDGASWITMGAAIKAALGEEGRQLWLDWSRQSSKSGASGKGDTPERRWKGLKPHSIGAGSIYAMALERGWVPPPEITLNAATAERAGQPHPAAGLLARTGNAAASTAREPADDAGHPAAPFLASLYAKRAKQEMKPLPVPPGLLRPGGVLQMLVEECVRTALRPQPFLALGAAICAVGALAGRKYRTRTDLRTNVYIVAVAESGGGKDHAPEVIRRCFDLAQLYRYLGGENLASGRGLLSALEQHPARLFQIDEFGLFLTTITGARVPGHKAEIWSELMKLYSRAKGVYRGTEYANKRDAPRVDIHQPCVCFYGTTTPSTFWKALEGGAMVDGSLARFLVFVTDMDRPERNRGAGIVAPSPELLDALKAIARGQGDPPPSGNLPEVHVVPMSATEDATPYTVPMTAAAEALHDQKLAEEDAWAQRVAGTPQAAIVNRLGENASKLALICAISRDPSHPQIAEADVAWGWSLAEHCTRTVLREADRHVADTPTEARVKKVLEVIRAAGRIDRTQFARKTQALTKRERDEAVAVLLESRQIELVQVPNEKGPPTGWLMLASSFEESADAAD